jgi:dienelactone hydrolase
MYMVLRFTQYCSKGGLGLLLLACFVFVFLNVCPILVSAKRGTGKAAFAVRKWHFLGPWTVGKNELDGDPAAAHGGIVQLYKEKGKQQTFFSEMAVLGKIKWTELPRTSGAVPVSPQTVNWNRLVQGLSSVEVQEWQGWAVGQFRTERKRETVNINCKGVRTFFVDTMEPLAGDMFSTGRMWNTVSLAKGIHTVYVRLKVKGNGNFHCSIERYNRKSSQFQVYGPAFTPDMLETVDGGEYVMMGNAISFPIVNLGNRVLDVSMSIKQQESSTQKVTFSSGQAKLQFRVARGQLTVLNARIRVEGRVSKAGCPVTFRVVVSSKSFAAQPITVHLRCRRLHESFVFTFEDHDGTVSRAASIVPLKGSSAGGATGCASHITTGARNSSCPVVLSLHGTGVDVQMQADSYKFKPPGSSDETPYTFGVQNAWVVAATRHGAHNWEYTGHLSAMTALETLPTLVRRTHPGLPAVDASRVLYTGHSMGGHGAWTLITHGTDRAIGGVVIAGWIRKEHYGDSNRFFLHDVGHAHVDPGLKSILESTFSEYNADLVASGTRGVPIVIRVGALDRAVPPWHSRKMARILSEHGANVVYDEVQGKEHWWWDTDYSNDGGVLNDPKARHWYDSMIGDGHQGLPALPSEFVLTVLNPAGSHGRGGFRVLQQLIPYRLSQVHVSIQSGDENAVQLRTSNVRRFRVDLTQLFRSEELDKEQKVLKFTVNGHSLALKWDTPLAARDICRYENPRLVEIDSRGEEVDGGAGGEPTWRVCDEGRYTKSERGPNTYGPARQVFASPFRVIVGTDNICEAMERMVHAAGAYIVNTHFTSTDTFATLMEDSSFTYTAESTSSNLVFIGGPELNKASSDYFQDIRARNLPHPPISFEKHSGDDKGIHPFNLGKCVYNESGYGLLYIAPLWTGLGDDGETGQNKLVMFLAGTDSIGLSNILQFAEPTIPPMMRAPFTNQVPDYIVVGPRTKAFGAGGIVAAGFWGNKWEIQPESSYGTETC